jgi:hypothetical protein
VYFIRFVTLVQLIAISDLSVDKFQCIFHAYSPTTFDSLQVI